MIGSAGDVDRDYKIRRSHGKKDLSLLVRFCVARSANGSRKTHGEGSTRVLPNAKMMSVGVRVCAYLFFFFWCCCCSPFLLTRDAAKQKPLQHTAGALRAVCQTEEEREKKEKRARYGERKKKLVRLSPFLSFEWNKGERKRKE